MKNELVPKMYRYIVNLLNCAGLFPFNWKFRDIPFNTVDFTTITIQNFIVLKPKIILNYIR